MRVTVESSVLASALVRIAPTVGKRNTIPILGCVLFKARGEELRLTATDLDTDCIQTIPAVVERAGSCTAELRPLMAILAQAPEASRVDVAAIDGMVHFDIADAGAVAALKSLPAVDFPRVKPHAHCFRFTLPAAKLAEALRLCEHAISRDETRFYLNGVCFCSHQGQLTAVATDGHRLVAHTLLGIDPAGLPSHLIVPRLAVRALLAALPQTDMAELVFGRGADEKTGGSVSVSWPGGGLVSRLIDGTFPDWTRVLPEALPKAATTLVSRIDCDHTTLARAVAMVRAMNSQRAMIFECDNDGEALPQLCLIGRDSGDGEIRVRLAPTVEGAPPRIRFNALYWQQLLAAASGTASIEFLDAESPISIRFADLPQTRFVLMPMRV